MRAVDAALFTRLNADIAGTATGTLGQLGIVGVFRQNIPQGTALPAVVFNQQTGTDAYVFDGRQHRSLLYQVKAVDDGGSALTALKAAERIDALLTDQPLTVTGWTNIRLRRESDVEYAETDAGVQYHHAGGLFRIDVT